MLGQISINGYKYFGHTINFFYYFTAIKFCWQDDWVIDELEAVSCSFYRDTIRAFPCWEIGGPRRT
jgi:hypothetical protein